MLIKAFDRSLFACVNNKDIYVPKEIPTHKSKNLNPDYKKHRESYIPLMNQPCRRSALQNKKPCKNKTSKIKKERETGLEPATPTLARSYSTNWATRAYNHYINITIICKGNTMNLLCKFKYAIFLSSYFTTLVLTKKNMCLQNCLPNAFLT